MYRLRHPGSYVFLQQMRLPSKIKASRNSLIHCPTTAANANHSRTACEHVILGVVIAAETSVRSPRKIYLSILKNNIFKIVASQKHSVSWWKLNHWWSCSNSKQMMPEVILTTVTGSKIPKNIQLHFENNVNKHTSFTSTHTPSAVADSGPKMLFYMSGPKHPDKNWPQK